MGWNAFGDMHTATLIDRDGPVVWLYMLRFERLAYYAELLGPADCKRSSSPKRFRAIELALLLKSPVVAGCHACDHGKRLVAILAAEIARSAGRCVQF